MTPSSTSSRKSTVGKTWLVRGLAALGAGLAIGSAAGVVGVNRLDPGRPGAADSLQLMIDSLRERSAMQDPREQRRSADSVDAEQRTQRVTDSIALANDPDAPVIPDVMGLEEGAARNAIEGAGLTVGTVQFRAATAAAGIVMATSPTAGIKARPGSAVDLVLSDGRTPPPDADDTPAVSTALPRTP